MISSSDKQILQETYKNSKNGIETISGLLNKVYDDNLNYEMNVQLQRYREINSKASDKLIEAGVMLENHPIERFKKWSGLQSRTIFNTSTKHIADMIIRENSVGMTGIMTTLKEPGNASQLSMEIAKELMDFEEASIRKLRSYL
jgi:hypothetical protein